MSTSMSRHNKLTYVTITQNRRHLRVLRFWASRHLCLSLIMQKHIHCSCPRASSTPQTSLIYPLHCISVFCPPLCSNRRRDISHLKLTTAEESINELSNLRHFEHYHYPTLLVCWPIRRLLLHLRRPRLLVPLEDAVLSPLVPRLWVLKVAARKSPSAAAVSVSLNTQSAGTPARDPWT